MTHVTYLALSLPAVPSSVRKARVSVGRQRLELGASERVVDDIRLCVSEAVSNVVRHAYGTRPRRRRRRRRARGRGSQRRRAGRRPGHEPTDAPSAATGGYGLKIIDAVAERLTITSAREAGTEVTDDVLASRRADSLANAQLRRQLQAGRRYPARGAAWARWPSWSSKPVRSCNPRLGRFDSGAAPFTP